MAINLSDGAIKNLLAAFNRQKAIVIIGTGITSATLPDNQRKVLGTWTSLLAYGIDYCQDNCGADETWANKCRELLKKPDSSLDDLLAIGDEIWDQLSSPEKREEWLSIFDQAERENASLIQAIQKLGAPLATANYDRLIEDITNLTPITLLEEDYGKVQKFINDEGTDKYVLHLHGYYKNPASIVLGKKSYESIVNNEHAQFINQFMAARNEAMLFVGFGQGVYDPNFRLFFEWVNNYFPRTRLYHLVKDDQADEIGKMHKRSGNKTVVVLGYGKHYDDLLPFLQSLSYEIDQKDSVPLSLPGKPDCIGKQPQEQIEIIAKYLLEGYRRPYCILGTGGMGKTNLVLNVVHHKKVANKYQRHRYFIKCDGATSLELLFNCFMNAFNIPAGGASLEARILNYLKGIEDNKLVVLDNFETSWDNDKDRVHAFVSRLQEVTNLVITMRGHFAPPESNWESYATKKLTPAEAEALFHGHSENKYIHDPLVTTIVNELGQHPLAVKLMAKRSKSVEKIDTLYREWGKKRTRLLALNPDNKSLNLELSIELSFSSTRLIDDNRAFLKALCFLPIGIQREDLNEIFDNSFDLIYQLKYAGLCEEDPETERITVLAPIREYVLRQTVSANDYLSSITSFYIELAKEKGRVIVLKGDAFKKLQSEWPNVVKLLESSVETISGIKALTSLTLFSQFSGYFLTDLLIKAIAYTNQVGDLSLQAYCIESLADLTGLQSNEEAKQLYMQALSLHEQSENILGKANCLRSMGDLANLQSHNEEAEQFYQQALPLYNQAGNLAGKANCLGSMGDMAYRQSNHIEAERLYKESGLLCDQVGDLLGKANSLRGMGDIAYRQSRDEEAEQFYRQALPLYRQIGDLLGSANCYRSLGNLVSLQSKYTEAEQYCRQSLGLFEQVGDLVGRANCLQDLGELAYEQNSDEEAERFYRQALLLYEQKGGMLGKANSFFCLGKVEFRRLNYKEAERLYKLAIPLFEQVGSILGKGNCLERLANLVMERKEIEEAILLFHQSLELFHSINDLYSQGFAYQNLGLLYEKQHVLEKANDCFCKAKRFWTAGKYNNLIEKYQLTAIECPPES